MKLRSEVRRTLILFFGLGLGVPTGMILAALLSRQLGSDAYGVVNITISIIFWVELSAVQLFGRTTVRFVSTAEDWRPVASTLLRLQLFVAVGALMVTLLSAPLLAAFLKSPALASMLLVLALDIPLYALAQTQGSILIGRGRVAERSALFFLRWTSRLICILVFLKLGFSVYAPLLGYVATSLLETLTATVLLRLPLTLRADVSLGTLLRFALPIGVYTIALELFGNLDLLMVRATLSGTQAGYYSAAQYFTVMSDLIAASLSPVLIGMIAPQIASGNSSAISRMAHDSFRLVFGLIPFVALAAGASAAILSLIYPPEFRAAAPALSVLLFGGIGFMLIVIGTAILVAYDLPVWTSVLVALLIPLGLVGHALVIRSAGMLGAAWVTTLLAWVCGLIIMAAACRQARAAIPFRSLIQAFLFGVVCYALSSGWSVEGWGVLLKLAILSLLPLVTFVIVGEIQVPLRFSRWRPRLNDVL